LRVPGRARHLLGEPAVLRIARDPRLRAIAADALGDEALPSTRRLKHYPGWSPSRRVVHIEYAASRQLEGGLELDVA
jgi:hypothetical protein